jgi:hypothetical protein
MNISGEHVYEHRAAAVARDTQADKVGAPAVVLSLADHVEDQIAFEQVAASHAVVEVKSGPRSVEANVSAQC